MTDMERAKQEVLERKNQNWCKMTGFNRMCFKCPLIGWQCQGATSQRWNDCNKRITYERKHGYGNPDS